MSMKFIFYNRPLSRTRLLEETDLVIENHYASEWIIASTDSNLRISSEHGDEIYELENHGYKNVDKIIDTIVEKFNITFYCGEELENSWYLNHYYNQNRPFPYPEMLNEKGEFDFKKAVCRSMSRYGDYVVLDVIEGDVVIPTRD